MRPEKIQVTDWPSGFILHQSLIGSHRNDVTRESVSKLLNQSEIRESD